MQDLSARLITHFRAAIEKMNISIQVFFSTKPALSSTLPVNIGIFLLIQFTSRVAAGARNSWILLKCWGECI